MKAAVKERPILFSSPMVRAIREGRKTQTRRIVKGEWVFDGDESGCGWEPPPCHCGFPGDRLWARETWALVRTWTDESGRVDDVDEWSGPLPTSCPPSWRTWYSADSDDINQHRDNRWVKRWRPSIHMPRWASRITLEITSLRVEQLNDISEEDAIAEGVPRHDGSRCVGETHRAEFRCLWESINGPGSWDANPWVWAISFRVLEAAR